MSESLRRYKADLFKALAHPMRIAILELLRDGELSVSDLQRRLAAEPSTVSQQLAVLRMKGIAESRKDGNMVYYRLKDRGIVRLLEVARRIFDSHLIQLKSMAEEQRLEDQAEPAVATP
jgi:DNA-binding transcriptional ArsR family regulator